MANLFIGFPVPRAKIADMIDGAAPPLEHKTQHQDGGDDELDLTGMEGAGGVQFPLRGLWIDDYSADHARWYKTYTGSGALTRSYDNLSLKTDDTNPSTCKLYRIIPDPIPTLTWAKKRHFLFYCYLDADDKDTCEFEFMCGNSSSNSAMGWEISGGKLYAIHRNADGSGWSEILSFSGAFIGQHIHLETISFPGEKVEFWVDGVLEHTATTHLPYGATEANYICSLWVDNGSTTNNVQIDFTHVQIYQEA